MCTNTDLPTPAHEQAWTHRRISSMHLPAFVSVVWVQLDIYI